VLDLSKFKKIAMSYWQTVVRVILKMLWTKSLHAIYSGLTDRNHNADHKTELLIPAPSLDFLSGKKFS
tara:strand:- start:307 stop:510 length:204 start_codon:yes stop_codon:yes gene_type:complete